MTTRFSVSDAALHIRAGECVGMPTETVYGLAGNAYDDRAVAKIFALKNRPQFNPLIIHYVDTAAMQADVEWNDTAEKLAKQFWPGPLTLVLPRKKTSKVSLLASAGLDTLAVRIPNHPIARELITAAGTPIAAPSANRSGRISPTTAQHVQEEFGDDFPVLDGGACNVGVESTVVSLIGGATILRHGGIAQEAIEKLIGKVEVAKEGSAIAAPGMLASHYAPTLPLRMNATNAKPGEALLGFGNAPQATLNLSPTENLEEAAANLFAYLRKLDDKKHTAIAVMPIPERGLGAAINDRLKRAATR